jgi:hypothetical protein
MIYDEKEEEEEEGAELVHDKYQITHVYCIYHTE